MQLLMESDVEGMIGAGRHERTGDRQTYRNGYRDRTLDTRLGSPQLRIPKLRQGSYFPPFLEPRKTSEKARVAMIHEAWVGSVSTRRVDDLVQAMGLAGISKRTVSKLCKDIDDRVNAFLERPLVGDWPYLWLDATYLKQREGGRIVSVAAIIACMGFSLSSRFSTILLKKQRLFGLGSGKLLPDPKTICDPEGSPPWARKPRRNLVFGWTNEGVQTMKQPCASAAKLRGGGPILWTA